MRATAIRREIVHSHCRATAMHRRPAGAVLLPRTRSVAVNALGQIVLPHDDLLESVTYDRAGAKIGSRPYFLNPTDGPGRQAMSAQSKATHSSASLSKSSFRPDHHGRSEKEWRHQIPVMRCPK
jgi:hypothetical protein